LEVYFEAVDLEAVDRKRGVAVAETVFIGLLVIVGIQRVEYNNKIRQEMRDWLGAGASRSWDDAVLGLCSTLCMLYSVYAILGVNS